MFLAGREYGTFHYLYVYGLENRGGAPCSMEGYPEISLVDTKGKEVPVSVTDATDWDAPAEVTLQPGGVAAFYLLDMGNPDSTPCPPARLFLRVTPPRGSQLPGTGWEGGSCPGQSVHLSPVHAGAAPPH